MPAPISRGEHHVLVVEDEALVAMDLTDVLQQQGFKVIGPAPSVARALALLDKLRIDAALLDLNLNGEPGLPVAMALSDRGIPFVIVSGYGDDGVVEPALHSAPRLTKPVVRRELVCVLAQLLMA